MAATASTILRRPSPPSVAPSRRVDVAIPGASRHRLASRYADVTPPPRASPFVKARP
ncbi:hypothetical protein BGLA2_50030 [Burkholderia gladioli]|nr:hypothetical protein BGLA2_50030 [Burkholderia gladioli]